MGLTTLRVVLCEEQEQEGVSGYECAHQAAAASATCTVSVLCLHLHACTHRSGCFAHQLSSLYHMYTQRAEHQADKGGVIG